EGEPGKALEGQRPFDDGWLRASPWCGETVNLGAPVTVVARTPEGSAEAVITMDDGQADKTWRATGADGLVAFPLPRQALTAGDHEISIRPAPKTGNSPGQGGKTGKGEAGASLTSQDGGTELRFKIVAGGWSEPWRASGKVVEAESLEVLLQQAELLE